MTKHAGGRPGAQHLDIVDAVPAGDQAVHQREELAAWAGRAGAVTEVDQLVGGLLQAEPLGERGGQQQPRVGDRALVIEGGVDLVQHDVGGSHRKGALLIRVDRRLSNVILPAQRALFLITQSSTDHRSVDPGSERTGTRSSHLCVRLRQTSR